MTDLPRTHYRWWLRILAKEGQDAPHHFNEWSGKNAIQLSMLSSRCPQAKPLEHATLRWSRVSAEGLSCTADPLCVRRPRGAVPDALDFDSDSESSTDRGSDGR